MRRFGKVRWMAVGAGLMVAAVALSACAGASARREGVVVRQQSLLEPLRDSLTNIAAGCPGEVGIALITDSGDTLTVNNEAKYPLMSVFKLHQAIALCDLFECRSIPIDTVVTLDRSQLNPETWSPMLKDFPEDRQIVLPVRELMRYTLMQSDNNAGNYMFETLCSVSATDSCVSKLIPRESFQLKVSEADMWSDHSLCYENRSSPLGAAQLINRLFTDPKLLPANGGFIRATLQECKTGTDRIVAPLLDKEGVIVAHKTGSGFRDADGVLSAHNDVAYVMLPDGRHYALAVFIKDYRGSEKEAAAVIACISAVVYDFLTASHDRTASGTN